MRRMHIIDDFSRMGGEIYYREENYAYDPELHRAFKDGYECGRKEAYKEIMEDRYGERHDYGRDRILYRGDNRRFDDEREMYDERRRRRTNGQFY